MPILITRQDMANMTAERFYRQYGPAFGRHMFGDSKAVYDSLLALGENPSVDAVEKVCGGWTKLTCDECKKDVEAVVQVGEEPDYDSSTVSVCIDCANAVLNLFGSQKQQAPFPRPWSRGHSTSDGEPIYDANGELVMMVRATMGDDEELQKLIVDAVNNQSASEPAPMILNWEALNDLPCDFADAVENCKLAIIRHRADGWTAITQETVQRVFSSLAMMVNRDRTGDRHEA